MTWPVIATMAALVLMGLESLRSSANERRLRAAGAVEPPADAGVYRTMQWAYPGAFIAMGVEAAVIGRGVGAWTWVGVALFVLAKALKYWAIATLGYRWSFRVLVLPGVPPIRRGPYAVLRHPNYVAVIGEMIAFGALVGAPVLCLLSVLGFGALIRRRIRVEERALGTG